MKIGKESSLHHRQQIHGIVVPGVGEVEHGGELIPHCIVVGRDGELREAGLRVDDFYKESVGFIRVKAVWQTDRD